MKRLLSGAPIRTCTLPDSDRDAITVLPISFKFKAKKSLFKKTKSLLSGCPDSNLRPSRFRSGRDNRSNISFKYRAKKKPFQKNEKTFVGVAGFEPADFPIPIGMR